MKRIAIFLCALFCLSLAACAADPGTVEQDIGQSGDSFFARVLSIEGDTVLVEALEDEWVLASSREFTFSAEGLPDIGATPGSYVNIVFSGEIKASAPAQIDVVSWFDISDQFSYPETVPDMMLHYGETSVLIPTFSPVEWSYRLAGDAWQSFVACGLSALDDGAEPLVIEGEGDAPVLLLSEDLLADQITAIAWSRDILDLPAEERLAAYDSAVELETSGGYILLPEDTESYLVLASATWNDKEDGQTPFGSACYLFLLLR